MTRREWIATLAGPLAAQSSGEWRTLFNGADLKNWRETPFTNRGVVRVEDGAVVLDRGKPMTGISWASPEPPMPRAGYEVRLEAARLEGNDFFATMTFPVGDSYASWVTGGWGGDIVGISSIDGWDASDNETRTYFNFENGRWYALRIAVTLERIRAWIDEQRIVDVRIAGRVMSLRPGESERMIPFGFASYGTKGALRKIAWRPLVP